MQRTWLIVALLTGCAQMHGRAGMDSGAEPDAGVPADAGDRPDRPVPPDGPLDGGSIDAGTIPVCDPARADAVLCPEAVCDEGPSWFWNGDTCISIECGACEGTDCGRGVFSREECEAAHEGCEASLCRSTGGTWQWWARDCTHYFCGRPGGGDCDIGRPICDCGPDRGFDPGLGCVPVSCPILEPPPTRRQRCEMTGGTWGNFCCDSVCGQPCAAACAADACDCGPGREFLPHGCAHTARCHEREVGETCDDTTRCEPGAICCLHCGGPGCFGSTCAYPLCDDDECTDICGNRCDLP